MSARVTLTSTVALELYVADVTAIVNVYDAPALRVPAGSTKLRAPRNALGFAASHAWKSASEDAALHANPIDAAVS